MVKPLAMVSMANVATKGGTLNFVITNPLKKPSAAPIRIPATTTPTMVKPINKSADGNVNPFLSKPAAMAPHNASTEPTDKSIPAVRTINVMPVAMQIFTAVWRNTFNPLSAVKNLSVKMVSTIHNTTKAISD